MRSILLAIAAFGLASGPASGGTLDGPGATLDALLVALHEQTGVPGLSAAISVRGETVWHGEIGLADVDERTPVDTATRFRLASVSKAVCSVIAARLIEADAIAVDSRAGELLPDLPEQYRGLTLRDLATHTAGLPHYQARDSLRGRTRYVSAIAGLEQLGDRTLVTAPGSAYLYSTHGFSLLGAMLERAAQQNFRELLANNTDAPDLSAAITLESDDVAIDQRTRIYAGVRNAAPRALEREDFSYSWCGAGMESTATGLSVFASSLFGHNGMLGANGQRLLSQALPDRHGETVTAERWQMTLGWRRSVDVRGEAFIHHAGVTNGARSILAVWPQRALAVALLSNASWTGRMEDTAAALAIVATAPASGAGCEDGVDGVYRGSFGDEPIDARMEWERSPDSCAARLRGHNSLTAWLDRFNFASPDGQRLIRLAPDRWGLVTSIGFSILEGDATEMSGLIGSRPVTLQRSGTDPPR